MGRRDPLAALGADLAPGHRISIRVRDASGATDLVGLITAVSEAAIQLIDRHETAHRIAREQVQLARLVPTVARGRNPRHADPEQVRRLGEDPRLHPDGAAPAAYAIGRLADLVDSLDDTGVRRLATDLAEAGSSRAAVFGEWAAIGLRSPADLLPLARWAARRNARNVVVSTPGDTDPPVPAGLDPLRP